MLMPNRKPLPRASHAVSMKQVHTYLNLLPTLGSVTEHETRRAHIPTQRSSLHTAFDFQNFVATCRAGVWLVWLDWTWGHLGEGAESRQPVTAVGFQRLDEPSSLGHPISLASGNLDHASLGTTPTSSAFRHCIPNHNANMRPPAPRSAILSVALALVFASPAASGAGIQPSQFAADCNVESSGHVFPFLKWLRDSAFEIVLGKSSNGAESPRPDAALRSPYRNDVVVRFNVDNSEEEGALARAAEQMLLDVWAFTPDYVDIRLDKDDVSALLTLLPNSLQPSVLIPDVATAVRATYPATPVEESLFEPAMADPEKMRTSIDEIGNIFFRDYQTLRVSWAAL